MLPFTTYNIPEPSKKETPVSIKWLWVVFAGQLSAADEELLRKICTALKGDIDSDVFMWKVDSEHDSILPPHAAQSAKLIISFGIPPSRLGLWVDLPSPGIRFLEPFAFIYTVSLEDLEKSPVSKKLLWNSMQTFTANR